MKEVEKHVGSISPAPASQEELRLALSLMDLTSLEATDDEISIRALCEKAKKHSTAAVCVFPSFVTEAKKNLSGTSIRVASAAGAFPNGQAPLALRLREVEQALASGADEIDAVISRDKFLAGDAGEAQEEIAAFKKLCGRKILKVILETGSLGSAENIRAASVLAIDSGADFIKTSTGKISIHATLESVCVMLLAIRDSGKSTGIKPSGGISDGDAAVQYLRLTETILGKAWLQPGRFRFGASRLADNIELKTAVKNMPAGRSY